MTHETSTHPLEADRETKLVLRSAGEVFNI